MVNPIVTIVEMLVPSAKLFDNFDVSDGVITRWDMVLGVQPTQSQIIAAAPAAKAVHNMAAIRAERDRRLTATDYMAMPDYPAKPANLVVYRQALRDFPATIDPATLTWPMDVDTLNWPVL